MNKKNEIIVTDTLTKANSSIILPKNIEELQRMSKMFGVGNVIPKNLKGHSVEITIANVASALQLGLECGLMPMNALQNIAVINGRPTLWGDAQLGLVRASKKLKKFQEYFELDGKKLTPSQVSEHADKGTNGLTAVCVAERNDFEGEIVGVFTVKDSKKAKLWGTKVWAPYPSRMLKMRARAFCLRDGFADVLKGLCNNYEEQRDVSVVDVTPKKEKPQKINNEPAEIKGMDKSTIVDLQEDVFELKDEAVEVEDEDVSQEITSEMKFESMKKTLATASDLESLTKSYSDFEDWICDLDENHAKGLKELYNSLVAAFSA